MEGEEGSLSIILRSNEDGRNFSAHVGGQWRSEEVVSIIVCESRKSEHLRKCACEDKGCKQFSVRGTCHFIIITNNGPSCPADQQLFEQQSSSNYGSECSVYTFQLLNLFKINK